MHFIFSTPTWQEAEYNSQCATDWNEFLTDEERVPEPTALAEYVLLWVWWIERTVREWRCMFFGHDMSGWTAHYDHPEMTEDGHLLQGPMSGMTRNCKRCRIQDGRGEY